MNALRRWGPTLELMPRRLWDWDEGDLFQDLMETTGWEKERWFSREFTEPEEAMEGGYSLPAVESYRHNGSYVVKVDLPGVDPKDIHLTYEGSYLTIEGQRKRAHDGGESAMFWKEVCYGAFRRSLFIHEGIKADMIKARYHDGVLEITAPLEEKFLPKEIQIEAVRAQKE